MYPEAVSEVLVFKTNICEDRDVQKVARLLDHELKIKRWNIDRDDIDNVLRVESDQLDAETVIHLVQQTGFSCEELPD